MQSIKDLCSVHKSGEAWLFGKGPSLDKFDHDSAGPLRICINESALHVPCPTYFFAHDEKPIYRVAVNWPFGCRAILEPTRSAFAVEVGWPNEHIYVYNKRQGDRRSLEWSADEIAEHEALYGRSSTVHSAIHFCVLIGVSRIIFVGFDGSGGYARRLNLKVPRGGGAYPRIRHDSEVMLTQLRIPSVFVE